MVKPLPCIDSIIQFYSHLKRQCPLFLLVWWCYRLDIPQEQEITCQVCSNLHITDLCHNNSDILRSRVEETNSNLNRLQQLSLEIQCFSCTAPHIHHMNSNLRGIYHIYSLPNLNTIPYQCIHNPAALVQQSDWMKVPKEMIEHEWLELKKCCEEKFADSSIGK
jgi:hypothetical protein